jgi:[ribosomal protein S18]-alanine N-acetyltransferase
VSAVLKQPERSFRPMREGDVRRVVAIEREAYEFPWSEGVFRDCLRVGYSCWVYEVAGVVEAYGIMSVVAGESHVLNLCVSLAWQGRRLGRELLTRLLGVARDHHADTVLLEVRPSNRRALRLYETIGFSEVGTRRGYYPARHGREDALLLALDLGNTPLSID